MASREFVDPDGTAWIVWNVTPSEMSSALTRLSGMAGERREPWLVFQNTDGEKRRLVPVPAGWETAEEAALASLMRHAVPVPPAPARRTVDRKPGPDPEQDSPDGE